MLVYATTADYETWSGTTAPDNLAPMLREASMLVTDATRGDLFDITPAGLPTDDDLLEAMRDATCAQVQGWAAAGLDPIAGAGGQDPRLTVTAIDGASLSYDTYLTAPDRNQALKYMSVSAYRILRNEGLASARVTSW